jgi:hypothetical protein
MAELDRQTDLEEYIKEMQDKTTWERFCKMKAALEEISKLEDQCLICDPADYDFNAESAHEAGSNKAFAQAASIAKEALAEGKEKNEV